MSTAERESTLENRLLRRIQGLIGQAPIQLEFDQEKIGPPDPTKNESVVIRDRRTLAHMVLDPELGFGDGYMQGRIEINGNLVNILEQVFRSMRSSGKRSWYGRLFSNWLQHMQGNTRGGSAANIHHHYDLNTDFYKLWLDSHLVYTCAYFPTHSATLEEAQKAKLEHVCRKLRLQPGERVVDAGCGWGALALHMARHYGVSVQAFNISHEQIQYARAQARREGLTDQVTFVEDDYRNISGRFDAFVSVGMLEHIGREHYGELGRVLQRTIGNSGRGLMHFIGRNRPAPFSTWIRKRIFPGAYVPALREALEIFERQNYSVLDVENLRLHYAKTLEHWLARYERSVESVSSMFGPEFVRAWRLYLAGSIASFRTGMLQLFQVVFAGSACRQIPWTRAYLYTESARLENESQWTPARS
ncbi:class I SAM-dependent methyltransferase [Alloacidobacterium dinghuense]|uniref:Class I SAM-dependent methyltransferase n=1 Tax=Alloacidobacterium dinghuense TaxID=2763107 RepID=A0A7G8BCL9_9BACT|nr:cyclopropane-fatty-acyl-phospholipid synthase family protein [Alloacidobacterium dinghuense]QNI30289.1 class I SAM-dependent methyltransferase [Alloacidobacterium dinghuense]